MIRELEGSPERTRHGGQWRGFRGLQLAAANLASEPSLPGLTLVRDHLLPDMMWRTHSTLGSDHLPCHVIRAGPGLGSGWAVMVCSRQNCCGSQLVTRWLLTRRQWETISNALETSTTKVIVLLGGLHSLKHVKTQAVIGNKVEVVECLSLKPCFQDRDDDRVLQIARMLTPATER